MLLAIDTSTQNAGVALWSEDRVIASLSWYSRQNHTAELMPAVEYILGRGNVGPNGLEGIAVALGPGRFSALKVGISAAKALSLPLNTPLMGVGTLEMEAYPYASTGLPICPLLDAGRNEVATALFQNPADRWTKIKEERVCTPEELLDSISEPTLLCGEGVPSRSAYLRQALGARGMVTSFHTPASRLWALAVLSAGRLQRGDVDGMATLQPLYLRSPSIGAPKTPQKVRQ